MESYNRFHSSKRSRCVLTLIMLTGLIPLSVLYVIIVTLSTTFISSQTKKKNHVVGENAKVVMLTGGIMTKSLHYARCFWKNGYKVVMVETAKHCTPASKWSRAVTHFETIASPFKNHDKYMDDLVRITKKYSVEFFVPVSHANSAIYEATVKPKLEKLGCKVFHFDYDFIKILDNKHKFCDYTKKLDLKSPTTFCVSTEDEARELNQTLMKNTFNGDATTYVLKNIQYDNVHRLDLFKMPCNPNVLDAYLDRINADGYAISPKFPWQVQQFIAGNDEYACFAILRDGKIRALTTSKAKSHYEHRHYDYVDIPSITKWVEEFAKKSNITGQISFDIMKDASSGIYYPIECNPRVHSNCVTFPSTSELGDAVLSKSYCLRNNKMLTPPIDSKPVFWFYNELFKTIFGSWLNYKKAGENETRGFSKFLSMLIEGREADFDVDDPLPFLMKNHFQVPCQLLDTFRKGTPWLKVDFLLGKIVTEHVQ